MPQQMDPATLQRMSQQAAAMGLTLDAFIRMSQGPAAAMQPALPLPQQKPFAQGMGPGGLTGGGQGQSEQPWQAYTPKSMGGTAPGIGAQISPASYPGPEEDDPNAEPAEPSVWSGIKDFFQNKTGGGGVSFGERLSNVGAILSAAADPQGRQLAPTLLAVNERFGEQKDLAERKSAYYAEQEKQEIMAKRLADNIRDTNPEAAAMLEGNPALVDEYMKGRLKTQGDLEVERYKTENDPATLKLKAEEERWNEFRSSLGDSSTLETYRKYYSDPNLNENEAATLASAHVEGGQEKLDSTYQQILDNRNNKEVTSISKQVASMTGLTLSPDQYVANAQEVIDSFDTDNPVEPIVKAAKGSKLWEEQQLAARKRAAGDVVAWRNASIVVESSGIAQGILQKQMDAEKEGASSWTGASGGFSQFIKDLPYQISGDAGALSNEFKKLNARMSTDALIEGRQSTETGGSIYGSASDFDALIARSGFEVLDQSRSPQELMDKLQRLDRMYINFMTPSPDGSKKSVLQSHAEILVNIPPERVSEAIFDFNTKYGPGMAEIILRKAGRM